MSQKKPKLHRMKNFLQPTSSRVGKENLKLDRVMTNQELLTEDIRMAIWKNCHSNLQDQIVQHKNLQGKEESNKCYSELWQVIVQLLCFI